jgi:hypothetical protein
MDIEKIIKPETALERQILADEEFRNGLSYGKPRPGHPEGQVLLHVREVLDNVDKYFPGQNREALRLIALIHDSFKYKVDRTKQTSGENHHAMIARRFAEKYIKNGGILDIIELHDEAYNSWGIGDRSGNWGKAENRAQRLRDRLGANLPLYMEFYFCDNNTGDKEQDNYTWFESL